MKHAFFISILSLSVLSVSQNTLAASKDDSRITYDVSGSQTTINDKTYQELNVGINWYLSNWLSWRNSAFQRQAQDEKTVYGLDTSFRLQKEWLNDSKTLGFKVFGGPGARIASERYNAYFGEAGVGFRLGGIQLSGGVKSYRYAHSREDNNGVKLPRNENHVFVTISGGGTL